MLSASTTLVSATKKHLPKVWGGHGPCGPPGYATEPGYAERLLGLCVGLVPCVIFGRDENDTIIFFMDFPK